MGNLPICITDGCIRAVKIKARGLCGPCYQRAWKNGELMNAVPMGRPQIDRKCSIDDCPRQHRAHGFCGRHLEQARRDGRAPANVCDFEDCGRIRHIEQEGLCLTHHRQKKAGKPLTPIKARQARVGTCGGPECSEKIAAKGLCSSHYYQQLNGLELTPIKRIVEDLRGKPCTACQRHGEERTAYTSDGLCRIHARRRAAEEQKWDRPVPQKAPNGAGHINEDGYRIITVNGRNVSEHRHEAEQLLGYPLRRHENVHHVNGNRADNRTDGPFVMDERGRLRSGNLEVWSTFQPAGQEIGPKLDWAVQLLAEYTGFLADRHREALRAVNAATGSASGTSPDIMR